VSPFIKSIYIF